MIFPRVKETTTVAGDDQNLFLCFTNLAKSRANISSSGKVGAFKEGN